ncbi:MAG: 30S ribosomal protein S5 [Planctomycetota bacterium]
MAGEGTQNAGGRGGASRGPSRRGGFRARSGTSSGGAKGESQGAQGGEQQQRGGGRGRGRGGPQREPRSKLYDEEVVRINRCDKVVKGGKRSRFSAFVVLGDSKGKIGFAQASAKQVPLAIDKAVRQAEKEVRPIPLVKGTIPHPVEAEFCSAKVRLIPASEGTGVIAGKSVRAVMDKLGVHNILTKNYGSNNPINVIQATFKALSQLRTKEQYETLRGVKL